MKEPILVAFLVLFVGVLIARLVRDYVLARRVRPDGSATVPNGADDALRSIIAAAEKGGRPREALREIGSRAPRLESPALRAAYYSAAGSIALSGMKRPGLAAGLYLKALRANPLCVEALEKLQTLLAAQKLFGRLERTYWEILGRLDDSEVGSEAWVKCWSGLAALYANSAKTVHRADAIRKALAAYGPETDSEEPEEGAGAVMPGASVSRH